MSKRPLSVGQDELATKARSLFRKYNYKSLPVVDKNERLVGIITRGDILNITSVKSNIPVKGLMSAPRVYVTPDEDVFQVVKKLIAADVGRAAVIKSKSDMTLVGIVSMHDILKGILQKKLKSKKIVKDIMSEDVATCGPDDRITKIWAKMDSTGFSGIPVLKKKKILGMITRGDIIRAGFARIGREDEKGRVRSSPTVEKLMRTPAVTISPEASIEEAIKILLKHDIGRLPVVSNEKLVGIIDREDILKACL